MIKISKMDLINRMVIVVNELDDLGMSKEADGVDEIMIKIADHIGETYDVAGGSHVGSYVYAGWTNQQLIDRHVSLLNEKTILNKKPLANSRRIKQIDDEIVALAKESGVRNFNSSNVIESISEKGVAKSITKVEPVEERLSYVALKSNAMAQLERLPGIGSVMEKLSYFLNNPLVKPVLRGLEAIGDLTIIYDIFMLSNNFEGFNSELKRLVNDKGGTANWNNKDWDNMERFGFFLFNALKATSWLQHLQGKDINSKTIINLFKTNPSQAKDVINKMRMSGQDPVKAFGAENVATILSYTPKTK